MFKRLPSKFIIRFSALFMGPLMLADYTYLLLYHSAFWVFPLIMYIGLECLWIKSGFLSKPKLLSKSELAKLEREAGLEPLDEVNPYS